MTKAERGQSGDRLGKKAKTLLCFWRHHFIILINYLKEIKIKDSYSFFIFLAVPLSCSMWDLVS